MNPQRSAALALVPLVALTTMCLASCDANSDAKIPQKICGTKIDTRYTEPLLKRTDDFSEYSRLDDAGTRTAPCDLLSDDEPVMSFRFAWSSDSVDIMHYASSEESISRLADPRRTRAGYETVVGNNGAIATASCKKSSKNYFTLTMQLPETPEHGSEMRAHIKSFMAAYMKATVNRFECGR